MLVSIKMGWQNAGGFDFSYLRAQFPLDIGLFDRPRADASRQSRK